MLVGQIDGVIEGEARSRLFAEAFRKDRGAVVPEGCEAAVECGIPQGRQKQPQCRPPNVSLR